MKSTKIFAFFVALSVMTVSFAGCGNKKVTKTGSEEAETVNPVNIPTAEETANYAEALADTVWVGVSSDNDYEVYVMTFSGDKVYISSSTENDTIEGYWTVTAGDPTLYVYSDAAKTEQIYQISWQYDMDNETIILDNTVVMTQTDEEHAENALNNMDDLASGMEIAAEVAEKLDGTYWIGGDGEEYDAFCMYGDTIDMYGILADDSEYTMQGKWGMDYDYLTIYDNNYTEIAQYEWDIDEEGNLYLDGVVYTQVDADSDIELVTILQNAVKDAQ